MLPNLSSLTIEPTGVVDLGGSSSGSERRPNFTPNFKAKRDTKIVRRGLKIRLPEGFRPYDIARPQDGGMTLIRFTWRDPGIICALDFRVDLYWRIPFDKHQLWLSITLLPEYDTGEGSTSHWNIEFQLFEYRDMDRIHDWSANGNTIWEVLERAGIVDLAAEPDNKLWRNASSCVGWKQMVPRYIVATDYILRQLLPPATKVTLRGEHAITEKWEGGLQMLKFFALSLMELAEKETDLARLWWSSKEKYEKWDSMPLPDGIEWEEEVKITKARDIAEAEGREFSRALWDQAVRNFAAHAYWRSRYYKQKLGAELRGFNLDPTRYQASEPTIEGAVRAYEAAIDGDRRLRNWINGQLEDWPSFALVAAAAKEANATIMSDEIELHDAIFAKVGEKNWPVDTPYLYEMFELKAWFERYEAGGIEPPWHEFDLLLKGGTEKLEAKVRAEALKDMGIATFGEQEENLILERFERLAKSYEQELINPFNSVSAALLRRELNRRQAPF